MISSWNHCTGWECWSQNTGNGWHHVIFPPSAGKDYDCGMQRKATSLFQKTFSFSSNQNNFNFKLSSKLKSKVFKDSTIIPNIMLVSQWVFLQEPMDQLKYSFASIGLQERCMFLFPQDARWRKKKNSVWEQSVTTKKKIKPKKQVLYQSLMDCLWCFIPYFYLEHHDLFIYILTNLWVRKRWGKSSLEQNYILCSLNTHFVFRYNCCNFAFETKDREHNWLETYYRVPICVL